MILANKGYTELQVAVSDSVSIKAERTMGELSFTDLAVARSLKLLLFYETKTIPDQNKEQVAVDYLKKMGWTVAIF